MPTTDSAALAGGGGRPRRKTQTKGGEPLKTYFICDASGNEVKRYSGHEARNAPPSAAARKLAKHVVGKKSGTHTIHVRARGPAGKFKDGKPKVFCYSVSRVMVDVPPYMIQQSKELGFRTQYEAGDKMSAYKVVSKRKRKTSARKSSKGKGKGKGKSGRSRSPSPGRRTKSKSKSPGRKKRKASKSARGAKKRLRGGGGDDLDNDELNKVLKASLYYTETNKDSCDQCNVTTSDAQQEYAKFLAKNAGVKKEDFEQDDPEKEMKNIAKKLETFANNDDLATLRKTDAKVTVTGKSDHEPGQHIKMVDNETCSTPLGPNGIFQNIKGLMDKALRDEVLKAMEPPGSEAGDE